MLLRNLEPEKFWSLPAAYTKEKRELEINHMINSGNYSWQKKIDGNYSAFICDFDGDKRLISRGISKVTGEYGRLEEKVFFFSDIAAVFNKPTRIMGEIWLENAVDKNIGSILRANPTKSLCIQDKEYYQKTSEQIKFSAKDKRDIENNEYHGQRLKWYIFDVWYYNGINLMDTPWIERQGYVQQAVQLINNPLVTCATCHPVTENIYDELNTLFSMGEEGMVCYNNNGLPEPGKRTAHKTLKIKRELESHLDVFITGIEPALRNYTGKDVSHWQFWEDSRTGEKLIGDLFSEYQLGRSIIPISKGYYYDWPGAIYTAVYDKNGNEVPICKVSGLTEEFKNELRDNFEKYDHCPVTIGGMALSDSNGISVRHPYLINIRSEDISIQDCTLEKIIS